MMNMPDWISSDVLKAVAVAAVVLLEGLRRWLKASPSKPQLPTIIQNNHHVTNITQIINHRHPRD
jgi:hypothetical protein